MYANYVYPPDFYSFADARVLLFLLRSFRRDYKWTRANRQVLHFLLHEKDIPTRSNLLSSVIY